MTDAGPASSRSELRLGGVPEHFNLPWHLAMESDELSDLELSWEDQPGGTGAMLAALAEGDLDVVSILTEGTILAVDRGAALSIEQVFVESPLRWGIHVPAASDLESESQLAGQRFAISRFFSGSHLMAFILADQLGFEVSDDQFVVVGGLDGARESFANAESEIFLWDRYMTQVFVDNGEFRRVSEVETPWPSFVIATRTEVKEQRPDDVKRVIDAVVSEACALHARPDIVDQLTTRYELDARSADEWLASTTFSERGPVDPAMVADTLATLRRAGF